MTIGQDGGETLGQLSSAGLPWLALDLAGPGRPCCLILSSGDATVIDIADPHAVPVSVNPLEPGPEYPVQAHADGLAGLFEAAFGLEEPVATAIRAGLRRAYTACGWDTRTGAAPPGAVTPPAVPAFGQLRSCVMAAAADLGYSQSMQASVRGFLRARLDPMWAGPAGRFLEGGHPVDVASLLRQNVLVTNSGVADDATVSFLAGVLLIRLAEQLRPRSASGRHASGRHGSGRHGSAEPQAGHDREGSRCTVVIGSAGSSLTGLLPGAGPATRRQAAGWFGRLIEDIRACGTDVVIAGPAADERRAQTRARVRADGPAGVPPVLLGRRSAACGERCRHRPCNGYELHAAALLAHDDGRPWLRLWVHALVLAFLTGWPVPRVPVMLRSSWQKLSPRLRECVLATVIDDAVTGRAPALRPSYDPRGLTSVISAVAARMLDAVAQGDVLPFRAGHVWVIPQLRWLHEFERVNPPGRHEARLADIAPPLDFGLAGLPDWPGIRVRERLGGLRRHPLSMESERNRRAATVALLGEDGRAGFDADLSVAGMGFSPLLRLRHAAAMMGVGGSGQEPGWLEVVLSWPDRIIRPAWNSDVRWTSTG